MHLYKLYLDLLVSLGLDSRLESGYSKIYYLREPEPYNGLSRDAKCISISARYSRELKYISTPTDKHSFIKDIVYLDMQFWDPCFRELVTL